MRSDPLKDIAKAVALGVAVTYGLNKLDEKAQRWTDRQHRTRRRPNRASARWESAW